MDDPVALNQAGMRRYMAGDYATAVENLKKAAGLGDIESHSHLSIAYHEGQGVERDRNWFIYHLEEAAIGGHHLARHNLGVLEGQKGNIDKRQRSISSSLLTLDIMTQCKR